MMPDSIMLDSQCPAIRHVQSAQGLEQMVRLDDTSVLLEFVPAALLVAFLLKSWGGNMMASRHWGAAEQEEPVKQAMGIRWLGDRKGIEAQVKVWDKVIINRSSDLAEWAEVLRKVHKRKIQIFAYANNHYAGHGPATVGMFLSLWRKQVATETGKSNRAAEQGQLFKSNRYANIAAAVLCQVNSRKGWESGDKPRRLWNIC